MIFCISLKGNVTIFSNFLFIQRFSMTYSHDKGELIRYVERIRLVSHVLYSQEENRAKIFCTFFPGIKIFRYMNIPYNFPFITLVLTSQKILHFKNNKLYLF